jgi:3-methyladenine DNA glycosylase AlkD
MKTAEEVVAYLESLGDPAQLEGMARFGMTTEKRLGISMPELRSLAKKIGRNHQLALALWETGIAEARIVAGMIADPAQFTVEQANAWVNDLNSWDVCDQLCMNLLEKLPYSLDIINQWAGREEEFVKRAAYALIACLAWHDKKAPDSFFMDLKPVIEQGIGDNRNYVKKAVSWALRNIGKRNIILNVWAIETAEHIGQDKARSARWIASDVLRELQDEKIQSKLKK